MVLFYQGNLIIISSAVFPSLTPINKLLSYLSRSINSLQKIYMLSGLVYFIGDRFMQEQNCHQVALFISNSTNSRTVKNKIVSKAKPMADLALG